MTVVPSPTQKTCFDLPRATCNLTQDVVGMPALCGIAPPALQLTSGLTIVRGVTALVRGYDDVTQRANDVWKKVNGGLYIFRGFCDFVAGPINTFIAIAKNFAKWSPAALPVLNTIASIATALSLLGLAFQCGIDYQQATTTKDKVLSIALGVTASLLAVTILLGDILTVGGISKGLSIANLVLGGAFCIFDGMQLRDGLKATDQTKKEMLFKLMMVGATVLLSAGIFAAGQFLTGGTLPIILRIATMAVPIITTSIFCREDIAKGCKWLKQKITPLGGAVKETANRIAVAASKYFKLAAPAAPAAAAEEVAAEVAAADDDSDGHQTAKEDDFATAEEGDSDDGGPDSDVDLESKYPSPLVKATAVAAADKAAEKAVKLVRAVLRAAAADELLTDDEGSEISEDLDNHLSPAAKAAADDVDSDDSGSASDCELEA